ncbi:hypothetical protein JCM1841_000120 [Sporobolomyces salmonicolor]
MGSFTEFFRPRSPSSKRASAPLSTLDVQLEPPPKPLWALASESSLSLHRQHHGHERCRSHGPRDPYFHYDHAGSGTAASAAGGRGASSRHGPLPEERENERQEAIDARRRTTSMDDVARGFEGIRISAPRGGPSYLPAPQPASTRSSPARTLPRPPAQPYPYPASDFPQSYGTSSWGGRPSASAPAGFAATARTQPALQQASSCSPTRPTNPPAPSPSRPPLPLRPAMTMPSPPHYTTTPRGPLVPSNPPIPSASPFHPFSPSSAPPPPPIYRAHSRPSPPRLPHPPPPRHTGSFASSSPNKPLPTPSQSPDRPKPPPRTRPSPASSSPTGGGPSQPSTRPRPRPLPSPTPASASPRRKPPPKNSTPLLTPSKPKRQRQSQVVDLSHTSSSSSSDDDSGSEVEPSFFSSPSSSSIPTPPPALSSRNTTTPKKSPAANLRSREKPSPSPARSSPASSPPKSQQPQCDGITSAGRRCTRSAFPAPLPSSDVDGEAEPDEQQLPAFCHQHAKLALVESGCFVLAGLSSWGGGGRREKWVSYSDWIMPDLPMQTQALLRHYMAKPVSDKDGEGYIYIHELVDLPSPASTTYLKLGRTIHPVRRLSEWRSSCPSREPIVRDILPRLATAAADAPGSMQGHQLRFAERGTGYHHRWERLCLVEVAGRASMRATSSAGKERERERENCRDCGKRHLECFEVGRDAFEGVDGGGAGAGGWVREVVERWERWCRDVLE